MVICVSNSPQPLSSTSNGACDTTKIHIENILSFFFLFIIYPSYDLDMFHVNEIALCLHKSIDRRY